MLVGFGIDIVDMARIDRAINRFGNHFLSRILTSNELAAIPGQYLPYVAGRFAAKEAAVKALGTGFANGIEPLQIEITREQRPCILFKGKSLQKLHELGVSKIHLSISHERIAAVAAVILESQNE